LIVLLPLDLDKGFFSGGDISDLESMPRSLTMIEASEGALPGIAGRIKNLTFNFEVTESFMVTWPIGVYTCSYF
jgi:hypothetical protein